jgi:hypothetical protein
MWQDVFVTMIAMSAMAVLGRRWFSARKRRSASLPACANCAHAQKPTSGVGFRKA